MHTKKQSTLFLTNWAVSDYNSRCNYVIDKLVLGEIFMKRTFQPKKNHKNKVHGFRAKMQTKGGRKVLARRRNKGRKELIRK